MARPSEYNPDYCQQVIEYGKQGMSINEIAYHLDVVKKTIYNWMHEHEEFLHAIKKAQELCLGWWEIQGRTKLESGTFNNVLWYMNMKNRHGWKDKQEIVHDVQNMDKESQKELLKKAIEVLREDEQDTNPT